MYKIEVNWKTPDDGLYCFDGTHKAVLNIEWNNLELADKMLDKLFLHYKGRYCKNENKDMIILIDDYGMEYNIKTPWTCLENEDVYAEIIISLPKIILR